MRNRCVDQQRPRRHEQQHRGKAHALGEGAGYQGRRDDRERQLEHREDGLRDRRREVVHGDQTGELVVADRPEKQRRSVAHPGRARHERDRITSNKPDHRDDRANHEGLRHRCKNVLLSDHARIEERETGHRHQQHQRTGRDHPGCVASADLREGDAYRVCRCRSPSVGAEQR